MSNPGNTLKPFWRYYGGKWRAAPRYPRPTHNTIVEPFAGAAGYSLRYYDRNVVLVEKYAAVAGIWRFLIAASPAEIMRIPCVEHVNDLPDWVPQEAKHLVGFTLNSASAVPCKQLSSGMRRNIEQGKLAGWTERQRERVASQVECIKHWRVIEGDYTLAPDIRATWFIDPPYVGHAGSIYKCSSRDLDFAALSSWCRSRNGQRIVCEAYGADWLPFEKFRDIAASPMAAGRLLDKTSRTFGKSAEAIWHTESV